MHAWPAETFHIDQNLSENVQYLYNKMCSKIFITFRCYSRSFNSAEKYQKPKSHLMQVLSTSVLFQIKNKFHSMQNRTIEIRTK